MQIKAGAENTPILVKMRQNNAVITLDDHRTQYGWVAMDPLDYELHITSVDGSKTGIVQYDAVKSTVDGLFFEIPAILLDTPNMVLLCDLKFTIKGTEDWALTNFEIQVTPISSQNSR